MAIGFGSFPWVTEPARLLASAIAGVGNGGFWPSQSSLLAGLTPPNRRHAAFALQRVSRNLGIGLGGITGGLIATTSDASSFTVLYMIDAITFVAFAVVLSFVPEPELPEEARERRGRYLDVLRHRVFVAFVALNVLFVAAGYAQLELLPVFAKNEAGVTEKAIGVIFFANTLVIVLAQLPVSKLLEGRRRMRSLAVMTVLWAAAWLGVMMSGALLEASAAAIAFGLAVMVFAVGECFQGPTQGALVADLAPAHLRGRYMAVSTLSWEAGFIIGPAAGGFILAAEPARPVAARSLRVSRRRRRARARAQPAPRTAPHARLVLG